MSYILDALKKSERERALENISTLSPVMPAPLQTDSQWSRWWIGFGVLAMIVLLLWKFQSPLQQLGQNYLREVKNIVENINLPDFSIESTETQEAIEQVVEQGTKQSQVVVDNAVPVEPKLVQPKPIRQSMTPTIKQETVVSEVKKEIPESEQIPTVASIENENEDEPRPTTQSSNAVIEEPKKEPEILSLNSAPEAVRQKLSALTLAAVSYTKDAERRFVLVNDQLYREGDTLPGGAVVEEINREGIVAASQGVKVLLRP